MRINRNRCKNCFECQVDEICPSAAVKTGDDGYPEIAWNECNECLICAGSCPNGALEKGKGC